MIYDGFDQIMKSFPASGANSPADKSKNKGGRRSKKQVFEFYMTSEDVCHGLKRGELIQVETQSYCSRDCMKSIVRMDEITQSGQTVGVYKFKKYLIMINT